MVRHDHWHDPEAPTPNSLVVAVSAVVIDAGRLLVIRRTDNNLWSLPGGGMEPGETVSGAVIREVHEETGYDVKPTRLVGVFSDPAHVVAYDDGEVRQAFSLCFDCTLIAGTAHASSESSAVEWIRLTELDQLDMHQANQERVRVALTSGPAYFT
jgi:ADP-ribose pyrophosphatase YjhB (NUDIX family)